MATSCVTSYSIQKVIPHKMLKKVRNLKNLRLKKLSKKHRSFDDYDLRLGDIIRGERATQGKSITDVRLELRLNKAYIIAIEHGDLAAFRTPKFIRGYVCSYAKYLGIDPDDAFEIFCADTGFTHRPEKKRYSLKASSRCIKYVFGHINISFFWPARLSTII